MPLRDFNSTRPVRVLVVDDDEVDRESVRRLLARANIEAEVVEEADALAALAILRRASFDVVVLDYHFPRHDGLLILRELREFDTVTPVIMLTGHDDTTLAVEVMQSGAADYIPKGMLSAQRLAHSVRHVLRLRVSEVATRAVQEALRASEALGQRLLEASGDCVTVLGLDGRLQAMSASGQRLLGVTDAAALAGRAWLEFWVGEHAGVATAALVQARRGQTGRFEGRCASPSGAPLWWDVTVTSVPGADGQPERLLALWRDITARRRRAQDERHLLLAVEHELYAPLVALRDAAAQVREQLPPGSPVRPLAELALRRGGKAFDGVQALLGLLQFRVEGKGALARQPADIHAICRGVVMDIGREHPTRSVVHEAQGDGHGAWDPSRLVQAIGVLVRELLAQTTGVPITIRSLDRGVRVCVELHSEGAPISEEPRSGPALALAREIVEAHGGALDRQRSAAQGTTFRVELPRA